jgi:peptidoglycan/xylan/chitin deacetylase (PgdA/CDA1 family)
MNIPILDYHKIDNIAPTTNWVTIDMFNNHMEIIKNKGYTPIFLDDIYNIRFQNIKIPEHPIVIIFDDGYQNFYTYAYPILKKYGFKATNFLPTNYIGNKRHSNVEWETNMNERKNHVNHLIWSEIHEMIDDGFKFESHGVSHRDLTTLSNINEIEYEIFNSKYVIEKNLNIRVKFFCAPYNKYNSEIDKMIMEYGYIGSVAGGNKHFNTDDYMMKMNRITVNMRSDLNNAI